MLNLDYVYYKIYEFIRGTITFFVDGAPLFDKILWTIKLVALIISVIFGAGLIYNIISLIKLNKVQLAEFAKFIFEEVPEQRTGKWQKIKKYLDSDNPSDWRWAVLEADSLLEDIIKKIGYEGESFGERLKKIKPAQFKTLEDLWKAHKVRNRVAHPGGETEFTKEEAENALELYESSLKELQYL